MVLNTFPKYDFQLLDRILGDITVSLIYLLLFCEHRFSAEFSQLQINLR